MDDKAQQDPSPGIFDPIWESDTLDIMDIHGHFWKCLDMDMVDIQMDIQNRYSFGYPCLLWISNMDIMSGYP